MTLQLSAADLAAIHRHGEATYPEECCGVMIGPLGSDGRATIAELVAAENEREDENRHNRYLISPRALLQAQRNARERGFEILGYYHSHPDHPARPSDFYRDHAWPGVSYLIVSVVEGRVVDTRSWRLNDDRLAFTEEAVETLTDLED